MSAKVRYSTPLGHVEGNTPHAASRGRPLLIRLLGLFGLVAVLAVTVAVTVAVTLATWIIPASDSIPGNTFSTYACPEGTLGVDTFEIVAEAWPQEPVVEEDDSDNVSATTITVCIIE